MITIIISVKHTIFFSSELEIKESQESTLEDISQPSISGKQDNSDI